MNFIKRCWEEIGQEFTIAVMGFFQNAKLPTDANVTWVTLAPKFVAAKEIKDFRSISMVGCVYKVISKVLVRRMRTVMPGLVGETQSVFVKGRKIYDGALIACETVQWLKTRKKKAAIIKLDFQKVYDRVRWSFVDIVLQKMGFGQRWRNWMKECVSSATMSVLVNGSPSKPFKMERGLRQGDPLSPLLFVLVVDVLHRMLGEAVHNGRIAPLMVGRDHIELSHLQFADDTLLFCPLETEIIMNYKRLLRCFELMSGLSINFDKSSLISVNYEQEWVEQGCRLLGCNQAVLPVSLYKMLKAVADKLIALQRRFMWGKEDGNYDHLVPVKGGPWKDICQLNIKEQQVKDKLISGMAMEVGDGRKTMFWEDNWIQGGPLKASFPRVFSVSNQQGFVIGDCGFWDGLEWIWNFQLRRELFQWELELVHQLHEMLRPVKLSTGRQDNLVWKFDNKGIFSTYSSVQVLQSETLSQEITSYNFTSVIWKGLVPPRIELFGWFVLVGRVWCTWLRGFRRDWVVIGTIKGLFESWTSMLNRKEEKKRWLSDLEHLDGTKKKKKKNKLKEPGKGESAQAPGNRAAPGKKVNILY
ncbi:uncharacterized protein LOC110269490 [Arachis ipaensis]|uniref:uncharacterized protein LOC110269490 n=1 Tax=Arachis ipaensis TaxID=130454 RepID=UPI000A2B2CCA|nr:uncharacterized protein LOC110269490 [Arachis ipaensis]